MNYGDNESSLSEVCKTSDRINEIYKEVEGTQLHSILEDMNEATSQLCYRYSQINVYYTHFYKSSKKEFTEMMTISEMESYLKKNKHIHRNTNINIVACVRYEL